MDYEFLIYGAGAIGSMLGGFLARGGNRVTLCARPRHVEAITLQIGLRMKGWDETWIQPITAISSLKKYHPQCEPILILTVKTYDTEASLDDLASHFPDTIAIVCMQNTVVNETLAQQAFDRVYGGVFKMTCSMLEPGEVLFRRAGQIVIGLHPSGSDGLAQTIVECLCRSGFRGELSHNITEEKWNKLLINLNSATHTVIPTTPENYHALNHIRAEVMREGDAVLTAAGIAHGPTVPGSETVETAIERILNGGPPERHPDRFMVNNGTWQNLYHHRDRLENAMYHEPIIRLGENFDIPTPYNQAVWTLLQRSHREGLAPESFQVEDVKVLVEEFERNRIAGEPHPRLS